MNWETTSERKDGAPSPTKRQLNLSGRKMRFAITLPCVNKPPPAGTRLCLHTGGFALRSSSRTHSQGEAAESEQGGTELHGHGARRWLAAVQVFGAVTELRAGPEPRVCAVLCPLGRSKHTRL